MLGYREILCWIVEELKAVAIVTALTTIECLLQSPWPENWLSVMLYWLVRDQRNHTVLEHVPKWLGKPRPLQPGPWAGRLLR